MACLHCYKVAGGRSRHVDRGSGKQSPIGVRRLGFRENGCRMKQQHEGPSGGGAWERSLPFVIFILLALLFHAREVFLGMAYLTSDHVNQMARLVQVFTSELPWEAHQWNRSVHMGFSWAREGLGHAIRFPDCVLLRLLPPFSAILVLSLYHFIVAQIFTYLYLRLLNASRLAAVFGAVAYTFSFSLTRQIVHYDFVMVMATTPLVFWLLETHARANRPFIALTFALVLGNSFLSGHPQLGVYLASVAVVYYAVRTAQLHGPRISLWRCFGLGVMLVLAALISAPVLLPLHDQISQSVTAAGRGTDFALLQGIRSWRLWLLFHAYFAPRAVGSDVVHAVVPTLAGHSWVWGVYLGVLPWFCVSHVWRMRHRPDVRVLSAIVALALMFFVPNLFSPLPDFRAIYQYIPIWGLFHNFERFLFLGTFALAALLSLSIDSWSMQPKVRDLFGPGVLTLLLGELVFISTLYVYNPDWTPSYLHALDRDSGGYYIEFTRLGSPLSLLLLFSMGLVCARARHVLNRTAFLGLAIALVAADLLWHGLSVKPTLDLGEFLSPPALAKAIPDEDRVITVIQGQRWGWDRQVTSLEARRALSNGFNLFFGVKQVGGYTNPILTEPEYGIFNAMLADVPLQKTFVQSTVTDSGQIAGLVDLYRRFSIGHLITDLEVASPALSLIARDDDLRLYQISGSLPRFYCSESIVVHDEWTRLLEDLELTPVSSIRPPASLVMSTDFAGDTTLGNGTVELVEDMGTTLTLSVEAGPSGTLLVHTDRWTREWHATLDDRPVELLRVNGMQQGVVVPQGAHTVRLRYHDPQLSRGLLLAGLSLSFIGLGYLGLGWRHLRARASGAAGTTKT